MTEGLFTKLVRGSTEILKRQRQGCTGHSVPCQGCEGFCRIDDVHRAVVRGMEDLFDAYGPFECQGEEWFHEETYWSVCVVASWVPPNGGMITVPFVGEGQSEDEALRHAHEQIVEYEADYAARLLQQSKLGYVA